MSDLLAGLPLLLTSQDPAPQPLHGLVDAVLSGTGQAVWIEGEANTGKTELLETTLLEAQAAGCRVAGSNARRPGPRLRLNPIMECLGFDPTSRDLRRVLNAPAPHLVPEPRLGIRASGGIAAERLLAMFVQMGTAGPLVVAIDDLHLADPASIRLWGRLAERTQDLPILLLATARPETARPSTTSAVRKLATLIAMA